jgi:formylglycine-generating enzyme required for sulfatase activity
MTSRQVSGVALVLLAACQSSTSPAPINLTAPGTKPTPFIKTVGKVGCEQPEPTPKDGPTPGMKLVPAGPFWRGCNTEKDKLCNADETPGRCITLSAFEIDATEVTQEAYAKCSAAGACTTTHQTSSSACGYSPSTTPKVPVVCVDWTEANTYCKWAGKRLPTEAEWEKAARGPNARIYPWGDAPPTCALATFQGCSDHATETGSKEGTSPYGAKDMAGNVWEWVADQYLPDYYVGAPDHDPPGPPGGSGHIGRGGGFERLRGYDSPDPVLRASFRHPIPGDMTRVGIGFRCAKSVP